MEARPNSLQSNAWKTLSTNCTVGKNNRPLNYGAAFRKYTESAKAFNTLFSELIVRPGFVPKGTAAISIIDGSFNPDTLLREQNPIPKFMFNSQGYKLPYVPSKAETLLDDLNAQLSNAVNLIRAALALLNERAMELHKAFPGRQPFFARFKSTANPEKAFKAVFWANYAVMAIGGILFLQGILFATNGGEIPMAFLLSFGNFSSLVALPLWQAELGAVVLGLTMAVSGSLGMSYYSFKFRDSLHSWNSLKSIVKSAIGKSETNGEMAQLQSA